MTIRTRETLQRRSTQPSKDVSQRLERRDGRLRAALPLRRDVFGGNLGERFDVRAAATDHIISFAHADHMQRSGARQERRLHDREQRAIPTRRDRRARREPAAIVKSAKHERDDDAGGEQTFDDDEIH